MILYSHELEDYKLIEADICIIGGGPSGISIALELKSTNKKIVVLTGGVERETTANQDLYKGYVAQKGTHEPLEENRRRAFGGASIAWGGRCIPFDPIDFKERSWIPFSGWPFSYNDLEPYYIRAAKLCKTGSFNFNALEVFPDEAKEIIKGIDNEDIISSKLERWSTPVNFAKEYFDTLKASDNVTIFLDTHLVKLNTEEEKGIISSASSITGNKKLTVKAKKYVLASGGIENPRLLLASKNEHHPNGIGNDNDVVGRYYMAHLMGTFAEVSPTDREKILFDFERDKEGVYCRRRWWISEKSQEKKKIGNAIFFLHHATNQDGHRDALFSTVFVVKFLLSIIKEKSLKKAKLNWAERKDAVSSHVKIILKQGWKQLPTLFYLAKKRFQKRRLPFILPSVKSDSLGLYFQTEQVPNPDSRITISNNEFDKHGMPRVIVNMEFTEIDKKTVIEAHRVFFERYAKMNIGSHNCDFEELYDFIEKRICNFNSAAHHLGTTRISPDPKLGVVNANCQVHGVTNLFITGSSVFPTGGHANPTLTIIALALKLADFLKSQ